MLSNSVFGLTQSRPRRSSISTSLTARPGITGLAQVSDIDMSTPTLLAQTDAKMIKEMSVTNYFKYIFQTVAGKGAGDRVKD